MRVRVIQGRVEAGATYSIGDEFELSDQEAQSLLALVPPPIEIIPAAPPEEPIETPETPTPDGEIEKPKRK